MPELIANMLRLPLDGASLFAAGWGKSAGAGTLAFWFSQYVSEYKRLASDFWANLTPSQYGLILIGVFVGGYLLMKSSR